MIKQPGQINPIKEIDIKLRPSNNKGLFHIKKINEIVRTINESK